MGSVAISQTVHDHPWSTMRPGSAHQSQDRSSDHHIRTNTGTSSSRSASHSQPAAASPSAAQPPTSDATRTHIREQAASGHSQHSADHQRPSEPPEPALRDTSIQPSAQTADGQNVESRSDMSSTASSPLQPSADGGSPGRIKVKSLQHIQSFVAEDSNSPLLARALGEERSEDDSSPGPQYEISEMPVADIIEMVAGLLTKITGTNDEQHEHLHRQIPSPDGAAHLSAQTSSVLAFHGKNVPSITILSYLSRIQRYCPTTYEVFLSLLVYFDRMTERVNTGLLDTMRQADRQINEDIALRPSHTRQRSAVGAVLDATTTPPSPANTGAQQISTEGPPGQQPPSPPLSDSDPYSLSQFFVVDSYNIHRLVIAGVTCASKFFSDVFYTNSRYAKVGGLPLVELNHLELQFLLLNDFRLSIPVEELEAYATMLVEFYAREVVQQRQSEAMEGVDSGSES